MEGFSGLGAGVNNEFEIVKNGVASVFSTAGSAIEEFVTKGTGDIRELSRSIIAEVGKAVAKLILLRVLQSASGLAGGGGISGFLGNTAQSFLTQRATGGPAGPGKPFLVGERGPEIFTPPTAGTVSPLSGAGFTPQVNVQVVNVTDPDEIPRLMQSREGQQAILNTLSRNPQKARAAIG
jgi:phage-related minor tail protein